MNEAEGADVVVYDAVGRPLATRREGTDQCVFDVSASGTYLVRVGNNPARRIVVVR
ncbi:MAG: T9SS type A sorting domain-containing protein [Bacteroidales bacterium]|nr:T9SS type A sorting domain-containing protein [Bacteroidales bacterium]